MTWNPIFPAWLVVLITLALVGVCVWGLVRTASRGGRTGWLVRIAVAVLIGIACLRPGLGTQAAQTAQSEVDVLFVVDTTASMVAEDWDGRPRMEGVKADIAALALAHSGARFGLITFDSAAVQRLPFTTDATALQSAVDTLRPEVTMYSAGSSIGIASTLVSRVLKKTAEQEPERARIVYYLGDGEQTSSKDPESFSSSASSLSGGAVLGYGTAQGGPMLETVGNFSSQPPSYIETPSGERAISTIDEGNLGAVAEQLGVPLQLRAPGTDVQPAAVDASKLDTAAGGDVETAFELYWIFALAAALLLLREVWVNVRATRELQRARGASRDDDDR